MADYRYLVFPPGKQPTRDEVEELKGYAPLLGHRVAFGTDRQEARLTIAFDADLFEEAFRKHTGFEALIRHWEILGCQLAEHHAFIKDATALRPVATQHVAVKHHVSDAHQEIIAAKQLVAREALGRAGLAMHKTLGRYAAMRSLGACVPYLLIAAGTALVLGTFFYVSHRIESAEQERRQETITRVADDPLREELQSEMQDTPDPKQSGDP
jgi:hypothetical protein